MLALHGPAGLYHLGSTLFFVSPEGIKAVSKPKSGTRKNRHLRLCFLLGTDALGDNPAQRWEAFAGELSLKSRA
jgi:hypothetical protein